MDRENVRLHDVLVPLCVAGVVASMDELDAREVEGAIAEHTHVVLVELAQVGAVATPHDGRRRCPRHVALDVYVVAHSRRQVVHLQSLVQGHDGHACAHDVTLLYLTRKN